MSAAGERVLARARAAVGSRFRLHGRDPATGLDCVGLAGHAFGVSARLPTGYGLGARDPAWLVSVIATFGLVPGEAGVGDLLLVSSGRGRLHFVIADGPGEACGGVHADLALGRVVERPGPLPWPMVGRWHVSDRGEG